MSPAPSDPDALALDHRFAALHEAALAITAELSVEHVLQRIVDLARELIAVRYAALGVADANGQILSFLTSGLTPDERAAIGALPRGDGLLGVLIRDRRTLIVPDMASDPRAAGFPPNHPKMSSLLGLPLIYQGRVVGDLYLTDKLDGSQFNAEDVRLLTMLAAQAAVAIVNAELFQATRHQYQAAETGRQQLQVIIDSIPDAVVINDEAGRRRLINQAGQQLFGQLIDDDGQTTPFTNVEGFYWPDGRPYQRHELPLDVAQRERRALQAELILQRPTGERRTIQSRVAPLLDGGGRTVGAVGVFRDITAHNEAEQLKDDFLSLVSHELRTPLTTIQGGARTLVRYFGQLEPSIVESLLHDIVGESDRLSRLVANMLDLSRIRAGRLRLETEPFQIEPIIRRTLKALEARLAGRTVRLELAADLPPVEGDAERIEQVLRNLLENAAKYVPVGGTVIVSAVLTGQTVTVAVADDGPGIPPDQLARIFERFHRIEQTRHHASGAGLGLYLSRHLIEAHGGQLLVDSDPGWGTRFSFNLPVAV